MSVVASHHPEITCFVRMVGEGIALSCRATGAPGRPLMVFLHGFPEAAFVWDALMVHFADPRHGGFRCLAPNLRGFEASSAPAEVAAYRPQLLLQDLRALIASEQPPQGRVHTLVAHDWGGALAWSLANAWPEGIERLVILNAPHPATFARELAHNPEQQAASAYMHWLARPGSEAQLAENDYARLFRMLTGDTAPAWLTCTVREQYRTAWANGLTGGCNLYRATPLKPPLPGQAATLPEIPPALAHIRVPTLVLWGMADPALRPSLLDGLDAHVPDLTVRHLPEATHWLVHEQPTRIAQEIGAFQCRKLNS